MLHRIINTTSATIFVWHITESVTELQELLQPYKDTVLFGIAPTLGEKLWHHTHFLSTRILLYRYSQLHGPLEKNEFGKPLHPKVKISITHSNNYAAIIISKEKSVAIDLEKVDNRIFRVAHKFLHDKEKFFTEESNGIYTTLIWSAKETLYKLYTRNEVIFKDELKIYPFTLSGQGWFMGDILKEPAIKQVEIQYLQFENYVLTWCQR